MRLINIRRLGRYRNKYTGAEANIYKGKKATGGPDSDFRFYLYRQRRQFITESDFFAYWQRITL